MRGRTFIYSTNYVQKIKSHRVPYHLRKETSNEGLISIEQLQQDKVKFKELLEKEFSFSKNYKSDLKWFDGVWSRFKPGLGKDKRGKSGVEKKILDKIGKKIFHIPSDFDVHKTLKRVFDLKSQMFKSGKVDWSSAESLAFGTLLSEGFSVRLSGQDSGRGTFSQRHAVLRNQNNHDRYLPLNNIQNNQKKFEVMTACFQNLQFLDLNTVTRYQNQKL